MILAAIDIGSNAARLLITEVTTYKDGTVDYTKLNLLRIPLRLGFEVFETGLISAEKTKMILDTMKVYRLMMDIYKVEHHQACATSAMRDAQNGTEIIDLVKAETGIGIEIISGADEANIIYETHIAENIDSHEAFLYIDVGGGSTELTMFAQGNIIFKESFNIGTIRLLNEQVTDVQWDHFKWFVKNYTKNFENIKAVGSGGNINKVFSLSKTKETRPLKIELLKDYHKELSASSVEERMHLYNIRRDRADVIVPALQIYTCVMRWAGSQEIYVPKIGLADGLIKMLYQQHSKNRLI
ncbi:MAG: exopolyphosphatase [Sphingobacteriales bacterium]|nr:MAG: exopolyphosphatase [Sphingobacteriales bacterium]